MAEVSFVIGAYLLGSLPVLYWIGRARGFDLSRDEDLHQVLWREVGYADLSKEENIIVDEQGKPWLIDFQISWPVPRAKTRKTAASLTCLNIKCYQGFALR